jgi:hypothetical protein
VVSPQTLQANAGILGLSDLGGHHLFLIYGSPYDSTLIRAVKELNSKHFYTNPILALVIQQSLVSARKSYDFSFRLSVEQYRSISCRRVIVTSTHIRVFRRGKTEALERQKKYHSLEGECSYLGVGKQIGIRKGEAIKSNIGHHKKVS